MAKFVNPTKVITGPDTRWSYGKGNKRRYSEVFGISYYPEIRHQNHRKN